MIKTIKYRDHRGGLDASMVTTRVFRTKKELYDYIRESILPFKFNPDSLKCEWYAWDKRIKWNTYLVSLTGYGVLGMADGDINELPDGNPRDIVHEEIVLNGINLFVSESPIDPEFIYALANRPLGPVRVEFNMEFGLTPARQVEKSVQIADWYKRTDHKAIITTNSPDVVRALAAAMRKEGRRSHMSIWFRGDRAYRWRRVSVETVFKSFNKSLVAVVKICTLLAKSPC